MSDFKSASKLCRCYRTRTSPCMWSKRKKQFGSTTSCMRRRELGRSFTQLVDRDVFLTTSRLLQEKLQSHSRTTVDHPRRREATTINDDEESQRWCRLRY